MLPTIGLTSNVVLTEKISTRFGRVGRGDIVVVRSPQNPRKFITKRLLGLEGDSVTYIVDPKTSDECETVVVCLISRKHISIQVDFWMLLANGFLITLRLGLIFQYFWDSIFVYLFLDEWVIEISFAESMFFLLRFPRDTFGYRGITYTNQLIQENLVLFLMAFFMARCSGQWVLICHHFLYFPFSFSLLFFPSNLLLILSLDMAT